MARTPISELKLSGSPNLLRALKRDKADAIGKPSTGDHAEEIKAIDALLVQVLKACKKGSVRNKKANPSFVHLALLIRCRAELSATTAPVKKSDGQIIAEADRMLNLTEGSAN
jgi:uncharacterized membrane protein YccC